MFVPRPEKWKGYTWMGLQGSAYASGYLLAFRSRLAVVSFQLVFPLSGTQFYLICEMGECVWA